MNQRGFLSIVVGLVVAILVGAGMYIFSARQVSSPTQTSSPSPNPVFVPMPAPTPVPQPTSAPRPSPTPAPSDEKILKRVGEQQGSFLIQKINPDSVEGLWYQAYPVARGEGEPKILHRGDDIGYACEGVSEKLASIDFSAQTITFSRVVGQSPIGGCPKCLAGGTLIDTPAGSVPVRDAQVGMPVWTMNSDGERVAAVIIKTSKVPVPPTHHMVHLMLSDKRELFVSPGHPTVDGRTVGDLAPGDLYDGAVVINTNRISYDEGATYDLLPSGDTGFYFANGILLGSTLR